MTLSAPIADCLDRNSGGVGYGFWAIPESCEDLIDNVHGVHNIRFSDKHKPPCYLISTDAQSLPICEKTRVDEPAFDRNRVAAAMRERKVTQTGMARVMRLPSQSAFSNIMQGKRKVTAEEAKLAYDFLSLKRDPTIQMVPVIGITSAGNWREAVHVPLGNLPIPFGAASEDAFALEVSGDSMNKLIEEGSHVVVDPRQKELRDGKCYLIQNEDGEATVKCYFRSPSRFEPVSTNPDHKGWLVAEHDFKILGRVVLKIGAM